MGVGVKYVARLSYKEMRREDGEMGRGERAGLEH